ncbi:phosphomannomutase [Cohaesibacter sp. ES.047]|uniref:phosphomannomutase n=1 Tax=Cohaesibacter sp. ES.047 TaxID=1798205 RepID=UPI000BB76C3A|nr:phosphomannomutase [Cohaesibacter sp. ES.047]SNY93236.1 phosphomannomutase [Cohaesibacter sp. ES.047]
MQVKFGTSGLRGLSTELAGMPAALYLTAFCRYLLEQDLAQQGDPMLVAQDFRPSSPDIAAICFGAIRSCGLVPVDCGTIPTPALALKGLQDQCASVMITGSHIPADRNGIKFYLPSGEINKSDELALSRWAAKLDGSVEVCRDAPEISDDDAAMELFQARNARILGKEALQGMKVGVYQHSSVGRDMLSKCLKAYGASIVEVGFSDHFIPVDTEAVSPETVALLKGWASEHGLDALVSTDGDADRPLVADETGQPLRGDLLGVLTSQFLGAGVIVTPVTSNSGIERCLKLDVIRTKVGSPFVIEGMEQEVKEGRNGIVGFEANGGFLTASPMTVAQGTLAPLPTRDCFLPILATLYLARTRGGALSDLVSAYNLPVAAAERVTDFAQERSAALMAHLRGSKDNLAQFLAPVGTPQSTSDIDGLRVTLEDDTVIHFRPSGNAPEMRCYVEAPTQEAASALLKKGLDLIRAFS